MINDSDYPNLLDRIMDDLRIDPDSIEPHWPYCICEHEPHDGECPEMVRSIIGKPWPCGCEKYQDPHD